ncbi:MAG: BamA/TamA family outer membrane protein [Bacteroidetes bacterium]|nr:BamA/TamA family outer membrane protein [Bacteroidota bacterium]
MKANLLNNTFAHTLNSFIIAIVCTFLFSCNATRTLTEGKFLVNRNNIFIDNKNINKDDINSYIKQKPNRKILGFVRFHLGIYNYAKLGKSESKFDSLLINTIGEPPVILDTLLTNKTINQIKIYLNSKGYFNSKVVSKIIYKKKKANIKYYIEVSEPYKIRLFNYIIDDSDIKSIVFSDTANTLIKTGDNFDADIMQNERERITNNLKNEGYYYFAKEFISFNVDSSLNSHRLDVSLQIRDNLIKDKDHPDSLVKSFHKRYIIKNINIYPDNSSIEMDNVNRKNYPFFAYQRNKSEKPAAYNFWYKDSLKINPKIITQSIFFKQNDYFKIKDVEQTNNSLMELKLFKFINIQFNESPFDSATVNQNYLDCKIQLTRVPVQSFSVETEATNSAGNLGMAGNILYQSKNLFKGAEIFSLNLRGAMEVQKVLGAKSSQQLFPFNTWETGTEIKLKIPKFLMPIKQERFPKYFKPKTTISAGINFQKRPDYTRYILNVSYGYEWKESKEKKHTIYFADINSVKISPSPQFENTINSINDPKIKNSYQDHLTVSFLNYSFVFNNQNVNKNTDFTLLRCNFETSGNILRGINNLFKSKKNTDGSYSVLNIRYAEYVRGSIDLTHDYVLNKFSKLVVRGLMGGGLAFWNSNVLPFEKSFFAGGANSIRAWRIYSLGPGSSNNSLNTLLDKTGDIDIEGNVEYRFPIYSFFKGALFVDAGNIWLNKKNEQMQNAEFKFDRFYKEFAIGAGFGARLDFSFFILRFDAAIPLRDPSMLPDNRWVLPHTTFSKINFNLGIGYPF